MSANHNRIRVADLEKNQPNKILITNENGELEFNNINKIQTINYNALDCTIEGKALDARQGKVLKDLIDNVNVSPTPLVNDLTSGGTSKALTAEMGKKLDEKKLTATIATDNETQIETAVLEDNKVVSRSKLFNWWEKIKTKTQTINALWNFSLGIKVGNSTGNYVYSTQMLEDMFITKLISAGYGTFTTQYGYETIKWTSPNSNYTQISPYFNPTQNNNIKWPNKSGTVALTNDFITTASGTITTPAFIIPNGVLTNVLQNGAIERDENGQLWETHGGIRSRLITTSDSLVTIAYKSMNSIQTNVDQAVSSTIEATSSSTTIGKINNVSVLRLNAVNQLTYSPIGVIKPTVAKVEVFLKIKNGLFATHFSGSNPTSQVKIMEFSGTNMTGNKDYQNTILTNLQNSSPLTAQWSTINFFLQTNKDDLVTKTSKEYYLRDALNSRTFGAAEASFCFVFVNTLVYDDAQNSAGQNANTLLRNTNYALYLETIK